MIYRYCTSCLWSQKVCLNHKQSTSQSKSPSHSPVPAFQHLCDAQRSAKQSSAAPTDLIFGHHAMKTP